MKNKDEIIRILNESKPELASRFKVSRIALFGSYARDEQSESSDVDIMVEVDPSIGLKFVTLADEIEKRLGIPVELVSRRAISSRNWEYIEKDLIYV